MEERDRQFIPGLGILLLAIFLLGVVGALLHDANDVGYEAAGAIIWGGAVLVSFLLGTAYISRRLLPIQGSLGWSEGFRLLWRNYTLGAADLLYGRRRPATATSPKKKAAPVNELAPSFKLLGAGFLYSHQAAAVARGNSYSRADGPGLVFLFNGESVSQLFDLRPQTRNMPVSAITRDGIPLETSVSVTFQVRRPAADQRRRRSEIRDDIPYPYDPEAIFDLNYAASVDGDDKLEWTEQVCPQAAAMLVTEIGKFNLDELLVSGGAEPLGQIKASIKDGLRDLQNGDEFQTLSKGIEIVGVGVGPLTLPDDVTAKRLSTWQIAWKNRVSQELISGDIEAQRLYQQARARAQVENIESLLASIEAMNQGSAELHEVVNSRLLELLQAITTSHAVKLPAARAAVVDLAGEASEGISQILGQEQE